MDIVPLSSRTNPSEEAPPPPPRPSPNSCFRALPPPDALLRIASRSRVLISRGSRGERDRHSPSSDSPAHAAPASQERASATPDGEWRGVRRDTEAGFGGGGGGDGWVQLLSVTSDNPQFHPASFLPQALPPDGETSFQASGSRAVS